MQYRIVRLRASQGSSIPETSHISMPMNATILILRFPTAPRSFLAVLLVVTLGLGLIRYTLSPIFDATGLSQEMAVDGESADDDYGQDDPEPFIAVENLPRIAAVISRLRAIAPSVRASRLNEPPAKPPPIAI